MGISSADREMDGRSQNSSRERRIIRRGGREYKGGIPISYTWTGLVGCML